MCTSMLCTYDQNPPLFFSSKTPSSILYTSTTYSLLVDRGKCLPSLLIDMYFQYSPVTSLSWRDDPREREKREKKRELARGNRCPVNGVSSWDGSVVWRWDDWSHVGLWSYRTWTFPCVCVCLAQRFSGVTCAILRSDDGPDGFHTRICVRLGDVLIPSVWFEFAVPGQT